MKSFPRASIKRHLTKEDMPKFTRRQARAFLERVSPWMVKPRRLRNIVRRVVQKSKTKEFADKLDTLLCAVESVHDLGQQLTAMNPELFKAQRDGTLEQQRSKAVEKLDIAYEELIMLI